MLDRLGSGEAIYISDELTNYRAVHYHYEQMGALVKLEYLDFPLIFEVIAFPDAYMDSAESLRRIIRENWKGKNKALPDFGANIEFLRKCYEKSRLDAAKNPAAVALCPKP